MNEWLDIIKIGGPVTAVSIVFLWFFDRLDKRHTSLIENHMEHNTAAMNSNTAVLAKLTGVINILGKTLKGKVIK